MRVCYARVLCACNVSNRPMSAPVLWGLHGIRGLHGAFHTMRVTVIGTGYVGTVTGACLAYLGHRVTCVDTDAHKIAVLQKGGMPLYEPHLQDLLEIVTKSGALDF